MRSLSRAGVLACLLAGVVSGARAQVPAPSHRALLIAVNEYQDPSLASLDGCLTDVEAMSNVLVGRFGFSNEDIVVLTDTDATRERILSEFERLIDIAGPETAVVVHFSGLGSAVRDLDGDEPDGWDKTLVPHDSGRGAVENKDITDDEIQGLLGRLSRKSKKITLIIDASVGGATAARASGTVRAAPADYREPSATKRGIESGRLAVEPGAVTTVVAGSPGSTVSEGSFGDPSDPIIAGVFSYYLTRRLWEAGGATTWRDVFSQVAADVSVRGSQPVFDGDFSELIFDSPSSAPQGFFLADPRSRGVVVSGGALRGLSAGSMLQLYPQGTVDFAGSPIATVRLSSVDVTTSIGEVVGGAVTERAWAVLSSVRYEKSKIRLRLDLTDQSDLSEQLRARLATSDLIELVDSEYDLLVRETQGELQVEGASTSPWRAVISTDSREDAVAEVLRHVDRRAQWLSLFELTNPSGAFDVKVDVITRDDSLRGSLGSAWIRDGETHTIKVTNTHTVRVYPVVLGLFAYNEARVLYPQGEPPAALRPGASLFVELRSFIEPGLAKASDVIKVIASTERIGAVSLNTVNRRGDTNPNSFARLLDYHARGSLGETSIDPRTWATTSVNVEVLRGFILWVDDDPDSNQYVRERFRSQGWETVTATSGAEALERLQAEKFDVVISDFSRPEDDLAGYRLLDELKKRRGSPPLIYYVANYTTEQAEQARQRGALGETNNAQAVLDLAESVR